MKLFVKAHDLQADRHGLSGRSERVTVYSPSGCDGNCKGTA